jgi:hypothetical protein
MGLAASAPAAQALNAATAAKSQGDGHEHGAATAKGQPQSFAPEPMRPAPPKPPAMRETPSQRQAASQQQTFAPSAATQGTDATPQTAAPVAHAAPEAAPAPKPGGRVEVLREALAACQSKGNFFTRQLCIQEVRWKYCGAPLAPNPLWGKIPECPNSAQQQNSP